MLIPIDDIL